MDYKKVIEEIIDFPPYNNCTADDFEKYVNLIEFISDNFEQIDLSKEQMRKIIRKDSDMIKCLLDTEGLASEWK